MSVRKLIGFMFCLSFAVSGSAAAQSVSGGIAPTEISRERRADVGRLLKLMNVIEDEMKSLEPFFENIKKSAPHVPAKVWDDLRKEFNAEFTAEMFMDTYVPIFARRFTAAEVKELIKFYESPAGRKMLESLPLIREEAFQVGYERGLRLSRRLQELLKARGYTLSET